ncbi:MAG: glycosyltransferase family 2 protein [Verrucomicrobiae bacterium]|nr:glycosyltransferase family 2 protein [Verrucomicrobiae bacterium]
MHPKLAVILINRNGFDLTKACIDSLLLTGYRNLLIVVVDNGSRETDLLRLKELAFQQPAILVYQMGYNAGFTKANNAGIKIALEKGADFVWILNNDTEVRPDAIDMFLRAFIENDLDRANTVLSSIITYADGKTVWSNGLYDLPLLNFPKSVDKLKPVAKIARPGLVLRPAQYGIGCSMFIAREFVQAHGLMNEDYFIYYDDLDYTMGCKNLYIQQPLVMHKVSATSGFKGSARFTPFQAFLFAKNGLHFYFRRKRISLVEKLIYLGVTVWVFVLLYVRDLPSLFAYLKGLFCGLTNSRDTAPPLPIQT